MLDSQLCGAAEPATSVPLAGQSLALRTRPGATGELVCAMAVPFHCPGDLCSSVAQQAADLGVCLLALSHSGSVVMGEQHLCRCGLQEAVWEVRQAHI